MPHNDNQTDDVLITDLNVGEDFFAVKIANAYTDTGGGVWKRDAQLVTSLGGVSSEEAALVLNHIDSCSSSYAGGYNAWPPQLNDLFITPSTLDLNTVVTDNFGGDTTIGNKTTWLANQYNLDQAASPQRFSQFDNTKNIAALTTIGVMGLTALAGFYFLKTKKQ